ncbi:MAG: glycerol-3-phosphate dehydrogenase [Candidatus Omnitrophica bacterium CG11_big_fil_rev_8_21_14_0_20_64_10]|nr:MAG: glycerol-3-phosphate dehydrogenase [Candidatus Omnitrophica bacterium CG11_big_fil_rev_8_21_14_0_20_64_10]
MTRRITVLGDGGWGTCLSLLLSQKGHSVTLWGAFPEQIEAVRRSRENEKFLPGVHLPDDLKLTADWEEGLRGAEVIVVAVPSRYLSEVLKRAKPGAWDAATVVSVVKGVEPDSLLRMSELIRQAVEVKKLAVLSGPTIAYEVARGVPTTAVAASADPALARETQELFTTERFRIYTSADVAGVELGGALKNVIAIACGISDGMGFGSNSKAALVTRGIVEMARLGVALGAKQETFWGLSGLGDLITTCFSLHSRNRMVGQRLGEGESLKEILGGMSQVAEGVTTARSAHGLAKKHGVEMPITESVYRILHEGKPPLEVVRDLMGRQPKPE